MRFLVWSTETDALESWFNLAKCEVAPECKIQKKRTESIFDRKVYHIILKLESTGLKRFNTHEDKFGSQWLNVINCKHLRLKLSN